VRRVGNASIVDDFTTSVASLGLLRLPLLESFPLLVPVGYQNSPTSIQESFLSTLELVDTPTQETESSGGGDMSVWCVKQESLLQTELETSGRETKSAEANDVGKQGHGGEKTMWYPQMGGYGL